MCHSASFWPPFYLHFGSPWPQKKQLQVCNCRQKSYFGPFWTGTFFAARSWSSFFHVFFCLWVTLLRKCAKMCEKCPKREGGRPSYPFFQFFLPSRVQGGPRVATMEPKASKMHPKKGNWRPNDWRQNSCPAWGSVRSQGFFEEQAEIYSGTKFVMTEVCLRTWLVGSTRRMVTCSPRRG